MDLNRFMGLYYTVSRFNMYESAQNLVGYIGFPTGNNRISMEPNSSNRTFGGEEFDGNVDGVNDRVTGRKKNISSLE